MSSGRPTVDQVLTQLVETPKRIAALTADLAPAQLLTAPSEGAWSANDVLAHLRSCADMWGDCISKILAEDIPTIRAVNPTTWIRQTNYPELEFHSSLQSFTSQRTDLLTVLESLPPGAWARAATVTGAGRPLTRTLMSYAERLASHERPHIKQIARTVEAVRG